MLTANVLAQDTTFTYQGQLEDGGAPFTGQVDMEFGLFDALSGGSPVSPPLERFDVSVEDGVFQVELDFGPSTFGADLRYLEIRVDGMLLNPRQAIRPAPIALFALDGNSGPQGEPGPEGPPGLQGPQGIQGPTGDTGPAGADGVSVQIASYSGALCPNGGVILSAVNGDEVVCHGEQGLQGPEGPAGTGQIYPLSQLNVFASSSSEFILFGPQVLLPFGATSEAGVQLGVDLAFFEGTGEFSLCWGNVESGPGTPMLTDQGETLSFTLSQGATGLQNFTGVVSPGTSGDFWVGGCVRSSQVSAESVSGFVTFAGN